MSNGRLGGEKQQRGTVRAAISARPTSPGWNQGAVGVGPLCQVRASSHPVVAPAPEGSRDTPNRTAPVSAGLTHHVTRTHSPTRGSSWRPWPLNRYRLAAAGHHRPHTEEEGLAPGARTAYSAIGSRGGPFITAILDATGPSAWHLTTRRISCRCRTTSTHPRAREPTS
jgi:hypothetical protein